MAHNHLGNDFDDVSVGDIKIVCAWRLFYRTDGNVRPNDGLKIVRHLQGDDLKGYAHGHQKQYYDKHGEPTLLSTAFFDEDGVIDR